MEVLNLATLEKQNEILAKPSGTDWSNVTTNSTHSVISLSREQKGAIILDIIGSGFLHSFSFAGTGNLVDVVIFIDGNEFTKAVNIGESNATNLSGQGNIKFNTSLKVTADNSFKGVRNAEAFIIYSLE